MRDFQKLDPIALKAFYYASESLSFTKAAEKAALTQSGVSQHIAKLESELGVNLFHRANRKVQLTDAGLRLKIFAERYLDQLDELVEQLNSEGQKLKGLVRYAMPDSCLMTPHFSILLEKRKSFSDINLRLTICDSPKVVEMLLKNEIDFGFITSKIQHKDIQYREFVREEYVLVSNSEKAVEIESLKKLKDLNFIRYPGMDILFESWKNHNFSKATSLSLGDLQICGEINSLSGAITMVQNGLGLGVFPRHCVEASLRKRELFSFASDRTSEHPIYIIQLAEKYPTARVRKVLDVFWGMKK
jgi:LysR family transcriptional regulator, transcriptional activator of the cysJI operon